MAATGGGMIERMRGAALLDVDTYEEVEHDRSATGQAATVVFLVAMARAVGGADEGLLAAGVAGVAALGGWALWAGLTYLVGTRVFHGAATWGELLRTLGFAHAPGILFLLGVLPLMGLVLWIVPLWMLATGFVGVRQALDIGNGPTVLTILLGWLVYVVVAIALGIVTGISGALF